MTLITLLIGIILGGLSILFVLQNVAIVTVTFFSWQITASLAIVLFMAIISGILLTLIALLPSLIRDEMYTSVIKRQKRELEAQLQRNPQPVATDTTTTSTTVVQSA